MDDPDTTNHAKPVPAEDARDETRIPAPGETLGAFVIRDVLARGGMGTVFRAEDARTGEVVALKLLHPRAGGAEARSRFRREFRALSRLEHPNVIRVGEWGFWGDRPWFSMELVVGRDLSVEMESWRTLQPRARFARVRDVLLQCARALAWIHDRGLVHRDITPNNILIRQDGVVKLMDFGLVKGAGAEQVTEGEVIGTAAWIAPEQILGADVDARADLYALGAVLYQMLTGRRPFSALTAQGVFDKHLHERPRPPHELDPLVPEDLERICLRLLSKDPTERHASAAHLLHALGDVATVDDDAAHWPPRYVGRPRLKASLRESLDEIANGARGRALLVTAPPGLGKSRSLDLAESYARQRGLVVARARCRSQDRPFGAFAELYLALAPKEPNEVLEAAFGNGDPGQPSERYPVSVAFRDLLVAQAPCVLLLDELQKADPATQELLTYLIRNTLELAEVPVVFVVSQTLEPGADAALCGAFDTSGPLERHRLEPLSSSEVEELVLSLVPSTDASLALAERLHSESNGSPDLVADMLRGLRDEGVLVREGDHYAVSRPTDEIRHSHLPLPASLRQVLEDRVAPLGPDAIAVGITLALVRRGLDLDTLIEAIQGDEERVMVALDVLIDADIVREERSGEVERVELSHSRFRDVLLERLSIDERRCRHQQMGELIERACRHDMGRVVEELAYHFEQAGLHPKAYSYLVQTAGRHLALSLYDESLVFLDRCLKMEPAARVYMPLEDADRRLCELHLARSQALFHLGQWQAALDAIREARDLADVLRDPQLQSRVATEHGSQLRNHGLNQDAEEVLRGALAYADEANAPSLKAAPLYYLGGVVWGHGDLDEAEHLWQKSLDVAKETRNTRAEGLGFNGLGILAICRGRAAEARRYLEGAADLFERLGMTDPLSVTRGNLIELNLAMGNLRKSLQLADRTIAHAREIQHRHGVTLGLAWRGLVMLELGHLNEARENIVEALRLARELGTTDEQVLSLFGLIRIDLEAGQPDAALRALPELLELLQEHDSENIRSMVMAVQARALVRRGEPEEAARVFEAGCPTGEEWPHVRVRTAIERARVAILLERPEVAHTELVDALQVAQANSFRFFQLVAHDLLARVDASPRERATHMATARSIARSLAASLPQPDAETFLARDWGGQDAG